MSAVAQQEQAIGGSRTEYRLVGDLQSVFEAIILIFREYDPRGYGTRVADISHQDGNLFAARVVRQNSCD